MDESELTDYVGLNGMAWITYVIVFCLFCVVYTVSRVVSFRHHRRLSVLLALSQVNLG